MSDEEEYYARRKAEYEASTDEKLVEWARPYFEGTKLPDNKDRYIVCPVSDRAADEIFEKTGSDVHGFNHSIRCDILRHVDKRHGKHGEHDNTISDIRDIGRIGYVLNNFDYILVDGGVATGFLNKENEPATVVKFVMRIDGHIYSAEALTDSPKKRTLYILSMYKDLTH